MNGLQEAHRVLKSGGVIGVREYDAGGTILEPSLPETARGSELYHRVWEHNHGKPLIGRTLRGLLGQAGFSRVEGSASYECFGSPEATRWFAELWVGYLEESSFGEMVNRLGWADDSQIESICDGWRAWGEHPDAFCARAWCEAVGWKE